MSVEQRQELPGMPVNRADVIVVGCLILQEVMACFKISHIEVSTRGVRHGYLFDMLKHKKIQYTLTRQFPCR